MKSVNDFGNIKLYVKQKLGEKDKSIFSYK
jgi:hypothetical protein